MKRLLLFTLVLLCRTDICLLSTAQETKITQPAQQNPPTDLNNIYYVSPDGVDSLDRDGQKLPWRSINFALSHLPVEGNSMVIAEPGDYPRFGTTRQFENLVHIQAATPHQSVLLSEKKRGPVLFNRARNISLEGFVIDNRSNEDVSNALQLLGGCSHLQIRNNVITHGTKGYKNADAVKIHSGVHHILIEKNLIYDGHEEEIDIEEDVHDIVIRKNVIHRLSSKSPKAMVSIQMQSRRIVLESNILANLNQECQYGVVCLGGKIEAGDEVLDLIIDKNIFLNNLGNYMLGLAGCRKVLLTNNLFLGNQPNRFFMKSHRLYPDADKPTKIKQLFVFNNFFACSNKVESKNWFDLQSQDQKSIHMHHNYFKSRSTALPDLSGTSPQLMTKQPIQFDCIPKNPPSLKWLEIFDKQCLPTKLFAGNPAKSIELPDSLKSLLNLYYKKSGEDAWYHHL